MKPLRHILGLALLTLAPAALAQTLIKTIDLTTSPVPVVSLPGQSIPIAIPGNPPVKLTSVAVNQGTNTIYVSDFISTNVYLIDGTSNTVTSAVLTNDLRTTVDIGTFFPNQPNMGPTVLMVNPITNMWAYLGQGGGARFNGTAFADPLNNESYLNGAAWDPITDNIYAGQGGQFLVTKNLKFIAGGYPCAGSTTAATVNSVTGRAYASCGIGAPGVLLAWDGAGFKDKRIANPPLARIAAPYQPAAIAVNPNTNRIYASSMTSPDSLTVLDAATHTIIASIPGLDPTVSLQPPGYYTPRAIAIHTAANRIYVVNPNSSSVAVFDGNTNSFLNTITTPDGAAAIAVNERTNTLYVANTRGTVSVFALDPTAAPPQFSLSGLIKDAKGLAVAGVTVTASGPGATATAVTDASGLYVVTGLPAGVYSLTPSSPTNSFTPFSRTAVVSNDNIGNLPFTSGALAFYTLSIGKSNTGTVSSAPAAIDCGGTCSAKFLAGTALTLTATPPAGKTFSKWGGACSGTQLTCTLTLTQDTSVQAVFNK